MSHPDVLAELQWRGLLALCTDESALRSALSTGPVTFYVGFDPTAPSLHIGHLVQVLTARRLQRAGHPPLALVGGATGLIGDPKDTGERTLNDPAVVASWAQRLREQISPFLTFEGEAAARMVDNLEWTGPMTAIELLRDIGKHFSVNRMLDREAVAARLAGSGISYTEFSYVLLQSNDYLELYRRFGATLQLGGSDQWGNITAGCDLIRRIEGERTHALATPLVIRADGTKFGKTEAGTVWLDPAMTSPYAFYQFWLGTDDRDVTAYLKMFTDRGQQEIAELDRATRERPSERRAQRVLARDLTTLVHGAAECQRVEGASSALFGQGELAALGEATLAAALAEVPRVLVLGGETPTWVDLMVRGLLVPSRSAARRAIAEGGVYANNRRLPADTDPDSGPSPDDLLAGRWIVLRRGPRTLAGVEVGR